MGAANKHLINDDFTEGGLLLEIINFLGPKPLNSNLEVSQEKCD